jgi:hypothetical protein
MFSLFLSDKSSNEESRIWFGGYDSDFIRSTFTAYKEATDEIINHSIAWVPVD